MTPERAHVLNIKGVLSRPPIGSERVGKSRREIEEFSVGLISYILRDDQVKSRREIEEFSIGLIIYILVDDQVKSCRVEDEEEEKM
ncbi:hypothetical protein [uncultured Mediterranean phage]|nr:hypothetical protein [uncultured Mediterranean phage]